MLMVEFASISHFPMLYCSKWHLTRRWNLQVSAVFPEHGKMTSNQLTSLQEQSVVMKFLVTESSKFPEIHQWLSCVFGKHAVEHSSVTEWCNHFHKGHESIEITPDKVNYKVSKWVNPYTLSTRWFWIICELHYVKSWSSLV